MSVRPRRPEAERVLDPGQEIAGRLFRDAHRAVALHVGVAAQGTDARAWLAEISAHQEQVRDQADVGRARVVLRDTHAVGDDRGVRSGVGLGDAFELLAAQSAFLLDVRPLRRPQVRRQRVESLGMRRDEIMVDHAAALRIHFQERLHDALERGRVAARPDLVVGGRDRGGAVGRHFDEVLRIGEALQRPLAQRVEHDDRHLAPRRLVQRAHHPRMVGARIVADGDDEFRLLEIRQRHRAPPDADGARQANAGGFVAHVRAIGKIVRPVFPRIQLEQIGRLVRCAARGVELDLVRRRQPAQHGADALESLVPGDRAKCIGGAVVGHGMGEPPHAFQLEIGKLEQRRDRGLFKEFGRDPLGRRLPRNGLGAVLAELEGGAVLLVRPGAAGTVEAGRLVGPHQHDGRLDAVHLPPHGLRGRLERPPAAGGPVVRPDSRHIASLAHVKLLGRSRMGKRAGSRAGARQESNIEKLAPGRRVQFGPPRKSTVAPAAP